MTRQPRNLVKLGVVLAALALPLFLPASALAETLTFVNNTGGTVSVQLATVVRGTVRRSSLYPIGPNEKVNLTLAGDKLIFVYDARTSKLLFQGTLPASKDDAAYTITQPDLRVPKVDVQMAKPGMMGGR